MKTRIKIILLVMLLALTMSFTFAWYGTQDLTKTLSVDTVELTLVSETNTDKDLVPSGFAWFVGQTESYTYVYKLTGELIATKELVVNYSFDNVQAPGTEALYLQYFVVDTTVVEVNGETQITIVVTLDDPLTFQDYLALRNTTGTITFEFTTNDI